VLLFSHTGRDDTYISYWPAHTLVAHGALLNYNGERVEQSSSLLYVLLLALAYALTGVDLAVLGVVLSVLAALAVLAVEARWARGPPSAIPSPPGAGVWLTATQPFFLYWAFSGMETSLAALLLLLLCAAWSRCLEASTWRSWRRAVPALAACAAVLMVRPEGVAVVGSILLAELAYRLLRSWQVWRQVWRQGAGDAPAREQPAALPALAGLALGGAVLYAGLAAFRWFYFGSWQPQPVLAKAAPPSVEITVRGLEYLVRTFSANPVLPLLAALLAFTLAYQAWSCLRPAGAPAWARLALFACLAQLGFAVMAGGDWMEAGRFVAPAMPLAALLMASMVRSLLPTRRWRRPVVALVVLVQVLAVVGISAQGRGAGLDALSAVRYARHFGADVEAQRYTRLERSNLAHLRDIPTAFYLDRILAAATAGRSEPVTVMSGQMGLVVYSTAQRYYGRVRFLDQRGLATREFLECAPTARLPKTQAGLMIVYPYYLRHWAEMEAECGLAPPEVIVDLLGDDSILATLDTAGYQVLYRQRGALQPRGGWLAGDFGGGPLADRFAGRKMPTGQFIAVRQPLADRLGLGPVGLNTRSLYKSDRSAGSRRAVAGRRSGEGTIASQSSKLPPLKPSVNNDSPTTAAPLTTIRLPTSMAPGATPLPTISLVIKSLRPSPSTSPAAAL
jgi:hypothetical protein